MASAIIISSGRQLRHFRQLAGLSQRELADLLGVSQPTISRIEANRRRLSFAERAALRRASRALTSTQRKAA